MFEELGKIINIGLKESLFDEKIGLPLYLSERSVYILKSDDICFCIVAIDDEESIDVRRLKKQLGRYQEKLNMNVAFSFSVINRHQRDAMITNGIPFVSLPDQVYLPFIGLLLQNKHGVANPVRTDKFTPASQMLFLLLAYSGSDEWITKTEAANRLGISNMSVSRASSQLKSMNLLREQSKTGAIYISKSKSGKDYLDAGKPFLISPAQDVVCVRNSKEIEKMPDAGETALGNISMLNPPRIMTKACRKNKLDLEKLEQVDPLLEIGNDYVRLELWRYMPELFEHDNHVDEISLFASLLTEPDERVQKEIESVLEEYKWL